MTAAPDISLSCNREVQAVAGARKPTSQGSATGRLPPLASRRIADLREHGPKADPLNVVWGR